MDINTYIILKAYYDFYNYGTFFFVFLIGNDSDKIEIDSYTS